MGSPGLTTGVGADDAPADGAAEGVGPSGAYVQPGPLPEPQAVAMSAAKQMQAARTGREIGNLFIAAILADRVA
ncbi:MAG: hypothetical protein ACR2H0_04270 [Candidatus Limnocylindrales bacterium]